MKLHANRQKSAVAPGGHAAPAGFEFVRYRDGRIGVAVVRQAGAIGGPDGSACRGLGLG